MGTIVTARGLTGSTGRAMSTPSSLPRWKWGRPTSETWRGGGNAHRPTNCCYSGPPPPPPPPPSPQSIPPPLLSSVPADIPVHTSHRSYQSHCQEPLPPPLTQTDAPSYPFIHRQTQAQCTDQLPTLNQLQIPQSVAGWYGCVQL